ncbi:hypothetical protein HPB48_002233 [Haemaphysalis longicornis]|uniref:Peptidyl-prolyl cis-trans isomerase n=1 Tax=Haemaphysalis longicornis TaxID=44386 RepID=A0A9J6FHG5_HAELO|nr:hypothetical protein HPB48_002233 [Haemaphysalis longicornis]
MVPPTTDFAIQLGSAGKSTYVYKFQGKNFLLGHRGQEILCTANVGASPNGSQFFLTKARTSWLGGKAVPFAGGVKGTKKVENFGSATSKKTVISDCGQL